MSDNDQKRYIRIKKYLNALFIKNSWWVDFANIPISENICPG